jgi:acid phosphatase
MTARRWLGWFFPSVISLVAGVVLGSLGLVRLGAEPQPAPPCAVNPNERGFDANLYMQTAAEYRACCLQTYQWMAERLRSRLAALSTEGLPPAVVMDLDETVLDNSAFESYLYLKCRNYIPAEWDDWADKHPDEVRLVPGAKNFIATAEQLGVTVVYISNRKAKLKDATIQALKNNGVSTKDIDGRLLLRQDNADPLQDPDNKTARRQEAQAKYRVLAYAGDNLRDFSEEFKVPKLADEDRAGQQSAITERLGNVEKAAYHWGADWFILPNPVYGEWQNALGKTKQWDKLRPTQMEVPAK